MSSDKTDTSPIIPFESYSADSDLPADPDVINHALTALWEKSAEESSKVQHTRITISDIVVITDPQNEHRAELLILDYAQERPSRSLVFVIDPSVKSDSRRNGLRANVSIACTLSQQGGELLCWERVNIDTTQDSIESIPNVVRSLTSGVHQLIVVDLMASPLPDTVTSQLYQMSAFSFFDSKMNRKKLAARIEAQRGEFERMFDFDYERDHPLREAIKAAFDNPDALDSLENLSEIHLRCESRDSSFVPRSLYMCGWLSFKLGLKYVKSLSRRELEYHNPDGKQIKFVLGDPKGEYDKPDIEELSTDIRACFNFDSGDIKTICVCPVVDNRKDVRGKKRRTFQVFHDAKRIDRVSYTELTEAEYMLRRLGDRKRRTDYTAALNRTLAIVTEGSGSNALKRGIHYIGLRRLANDERLMNAAADMFVTIMRDAVIKRGQFTVALAGGSTPVGLYRRLASSVYFACTEWSNSYFFFGDERSVGPAHSDSNFRTALETLLKPLGIDEDHIFRMEGERDNLNSAAVDYENSVIRTVRERSPSGAPRFDLVLLGMGGDGHTASIFADYPDGKIDSERLVTEVYVGSMKTHRLTFTPRLISAARHIMFLVGGESKADAVKRTIMDKSTPASRIYPERGRVTYLLDTAAASKLDKSQLPLHVEIW